jgi:hypothetical protein
VEDPRGGQFLIKAVVSQTMMTMMLMMIQSVKIQIQVCFNSNN